MPDNLKSAVTKANRYDPTINHLFAEFAAHYGTTILPTRVRAPRDKGSVESAVLIKERGKIGTSTAAVAEAIMKKCSHPQQGFRAVQGLLSLAKAYEPERVENACGKALHFKSTKLADIKSILKNRLDAQQVLHFPTMPSVDHENIRGGDYYQQ